MVSVAKRGAARGRAFRRPSRGFRRLLAEALEHRHLLAGDADWYAAPRPEWFGSVKGPVLLGDDRQSNVSTRFVVRLDQELSAALGSAENAWQIFHPATVVAADATPPWLAFRAVMGLGMPGQILVEAYGHAEVAAADLAALEHVDSVQPERLIAGSELPNDTLFSEQYALHNTDQNNGTDDADIDGPEAWEIATGSASVVVAVIDSGVDYTHPDLADNIWTNPGEVSGNGIDDDQNGFVDDVHGYDFLNNDADPMDDNGHGTHVAGTIGAVGNNAQGVSGINWVTSLMPLKFLDRNLKGTSSAAIQAINYLTMMKTRPNQPVNIRVSNNSWGFSGGIDVELRQAVERAGNLGILTVAAAGNGNILGIGIDNDENPFFPASLDNDTVIAVAATDRNDELARFSNFGRTTVDIAAPGVSILSTLPGDLYGNKSGTSMATAYVSGVAALVLAEHPLATVQEVRQSILQSAEQVAALAPRLATGGRLNAHLALTAETFAPRASLQLATAITQPTPETIVTVRYQDEDGIDVASIAPSNITVSRVGFSNSFAEITLNPQTDLTSIAFNDFNADGLRNLGEPSTTLDVRYHVTPDSGSFDATTAGTWVIEVQPNQVFNVNQLAAPYTAVGQFNVSITDPDRRVFIVNTLNDTVDKTLGDGKAEDALGRTSLRSAVMEANHRTGLHTVVLPDGVYSLTLDELANDLIGRGGDLDILGKIEIRGTGTSSTIIDAQQKSRAFELIRATEHPGAKIASELTLKSLAMKNGNTAGSGGAILLQGDVVNGSVLRIERSLLSFNTSDSRGGAVASLDASNIVTIEATTLDRNLTRDVFSQDSGGGAIYNRGRLTITSSTISNNVANGGLLGEGGGGGVLHVGSALLAVRNSTISSNTATQSVGGGLTVTGPANIDSVTITLNRAPHGTGGGLFQSGNASFTLQNTIIAENEASVSASAQPNYRGTPAISQVNIIGGSPGLGPLQDNGGPTWTHGLEASSPAINHGSTTLTVDQRGMLRNYPQTSDIGAVERYSQIRGYKFVDQNGDAVRQPDEPGISGQTIYVDSNQNGRLDPGEPTTVTSSDDPSTPGTDETGLYLLTNLAVGSKLLTAAPALGVNDQLPEAIIPGATASFKEIVATISTPRPEGGTFTELTPPVMANGTIVFKGRSAAGASEFDTSFDGDSNGNGKVVTAIGNIDDKITAMAIDSLGKIIVAGYSNNGTNYDFVVARYEKNGELDFGFGNGGKIITDFSAGDDFAHALALDSIGRIVVAGSTGPDGNRDFALARYTTAGALDTEFNGTGKLVIIRPQDDVAYSVVINRSSRIIAGGRISNDFGLVQLTESGTPDAAFDGDGIALTDINVNTIDWISSLAQTDRIVAAGRAHADGPNMRFAVARFNTNGSLDSSFNANNCCNADGIVMTSFTDQIGSVLTTGPSAAHSVAIDPYGGIVVLGTVSPPNAPTAMALVGYRADGSIGGSYLQRTLSVGGPNSSNGTSMAFDSYGRLVIAGSRIGEYGVVRLNSPDDRLGGVGQGDNTFAPGTGGLIFEVNVTAGEDNATAVAIDAAGRIVLAGYSTEAGKTKFSLARLNGDREALYAVAPDGSLSTIATPDDTLTSDTFLQPILTYDFDGSTVIMSGGRNSQADQITLATLGETPVPVRGYPGIPTTDISIGNSLAAFRTLSGTVQITGLNPDAPTVATAIQAAPGGVSTYKSFPTLHVDALRNTVAFAQQDLLDPADPFLARIGSGDGLEEIVFPPVNLTEFEYRLFFDATNDEYIIDIVHSDDPTHNPLHDVYRITREQSQFKATRIAHSRMAFPGDVPGFHDYGFDGAEISNRTIALTGGEGLKRIDLILDDNSIVPVMKSGNAPNPAFNGRIIERVYLADGNFFQQNKIAFLANFGTLKQAIYVAEISSVPGFKLLLNNSIEDTIVDFPATLSTGEVHGLVFNDADRDGNRDDGEDTLFDRTVYIDANRNGNLDDNEVTTITNLGGSYFFDNLDPLQTYNIAIQPPAGELQTAPLTNGGQYLIKTGPGEIITGMNFGLAPSSAGGASARSTLTGSLLISANGQGNLPGGATSRLSEFLDDLLVYLDENNNGQLDRNQFIDEMTSAPDDQGRYSFTSLPNSNVQVRLVRPSHMLQTSPQVTNSFTEKQDGFPVKPQSAASGNFDNAGPDELAVTMSNADEVWIVRPSTSGPVTVLQKLKTHDHPAGIVVGDLNGDAWPDLVVSNSYSHEISIFINQQDPAAPFRTTTNLHYKTRSAAPTAGLPLGLALGKFNGDDKLDIAVTNQLTKDVAIFFNDTSPYPGQNVVFRLASQPAVGKNPVAVVAKDFTGDGLIDLAVANNGDGSAASSSITILRGSAAGAFTLFKTILVPRGPTAIAAEDLNGDGRLDLATSNYLANKVTIVWNRGNGVFENQELSAGVGPSSVTLQDIDGVNGPDIIVSNGSDAAAKNHVLVIRNQGGGVFKAAEPGGAADFKLDSAFSIVAGNFDLLTGVDLALLNPTLASGARFATGQLSVYFNNIISDGSFRVALETPQDINQLNFDLAFPWHNVFNKLDASGDGAVAPDDALSVVNYINTNGSVQQLPTNGLMGPYCKVNKPCIDTNNDGAAAPEDALSIINFINTFGSGEGEYLDTEGPVDASSATFPDSSSHGGLLEDRLMELLAADVSLQPRRRR